MATTLTTQPIAPSFFEAAEETLVAWLGSAGVLINTRRTVLLIDPLITMIDGDGGQVLEDGHRLKIDLPVRSDELPRADAVLYTHTDDDHFGRRTAERLDRRLAPAFVGPPPVVAELRKLGVPDDRITTAHDDEAITIAAAEITVTPALHDWNAEDPFRRGDCCGYRVKTPDGTIWHPGDTRLIDELLDVRDVDVLFFDMADARAHLGPEGSARLAGSCGATDIIAYHYGTYDVPPGGTFGGDPEKHRDLIAALPGRFLVLNPGQPLHLRSRAI